MKSMLLKTVMILGAAFITLNVTACNTTKGAGRDMERAGQKVQDAADK